MGKVVGEYEVRELIKKSADYDGKWNEFLYFRRPVIYFLMRKGELIYIGETMRLGSRIDSHLSRKKWKFDRIFFIYANDDNSRYEFEQRLIKIFNPQYNQRYKTTINKTNPL